MAKRFGLLIFGIIISISLYGCATLVVGAVGGAGTAFWLSGKLSETLDSPREKVVDAAKSALKSLDMPVRKETAAADVTQIISTYKDGSETWIDIRPISEKSAKVEIRVGMRGNKLASQEILKKIKSHLGKMF